MLLEAFRYCSLASMWRFGIIGFDGCEFRLLKPANFGFQVRKTSVLIKFADPILMFDKIYDVSRQKFEWGSEMPSDGRREEFIDGGCEEVHNNIQYIRGSIGGLSFTV